MADSAGMTDCWRSVHKLVLSSLQISSVPFTPA